MNRRLIAVASSLIAIVFKPSAAMWFWVVRWRRHHLFLLYLGANQIGRPSILALPLVYVGWAVQLMGRVWRRIFTEYALRHYENFLKHHYSPEGVGYFNHDALTDEERMELFANGVSRLTYYIDHNPSLLEYRDSDSFLDAGCGRGQNLKELVHRYPKARVKGFDLNEGALRVIEVGLGERNGVEVEKGSVVDTAYMAKYPDKSVDHLIISHVFSFLVASDIEGTKQLRQAVVAQLLRVARKTVIILDAVVVGGGSEVELIIEQNTRCILNESLAAYFSDYADEGELCVAFAPENQALIFKFNSSHRLH